MKTIFQIPNRALAASVVALLVFCVSAHTVMADTPLAYYEVSSHTLWFRVVSDAAASEFLAEHPQSAWSGEEQMRTGQMKKAPWLAYKDEITTVIFEPSFALFHPTTVYAWFSGCKNLTSLIGTGNLKLNEATDMQYMFSDCSSLKEIDLSGLNTKNVKYMSNMFINCSSLESVDFGSIDTRSLLSTRSMFYGASKLESVDMSQLNFSNVTSMSRMFQECSALKSVKLSKESTPNLTDMSYLFYRCTQLKGVDLSGFNTHNVTDMSYMFEFCSSLEEVDLRTFDTSSLKVASEMFSHCTRLKKLYSDKDWKVESILFFNCPKLSGSILFDPKKYSGLLFANTYNGYFTPSSFNEQKACAVWCEDNETLYLTSTKTPFRIGASFNGTPITDWWWCQELTDCGKLGKSVWLNGYNRTSFKTVVFTKEFLNAADKVKSVRSWFDGCSRLQSVTGWENFDTSELTDMGHMFNQCTSLKSLDGISCLNTSKVTDMDSLFNDCQKLEELDLSGFNTSKVKNFADMFGRCYALTTIDVDNFSTESAENFKQMFYYCTGLTTIYCNQSWTKDVLSEKMFYRCEKLKGSIKYDSKKVDAAYANPDNGYFTKIQPYDLWICGTQVTNRNCGDLTVIDGVDVTTDDGYFYYNPESNRLKIKNGIAFCKDDYALYSNMKDLTIETDKDGTALIQTQTGNSAMFLEKRTYITGGLLMAIGGGLLDPTTTGLIAKHMIRVEDGILVAAGTYGISGYYDMQNGIMTYYGGLAIKGESGVSAYGTQASISTLGSFSMDENIKIIEPEGAVFSNKNFMLDGEIIKNASVVMMYVEPEITGDVNQDGNVDISDIVAIINTIAGDDTYKERANVNGDSNVDISDIVAVINIIASK